MVKAGILRGTAVGWDHLEAPLLAGLACDLWVVLVGPHGSCKTKVLKSLALSLDERLQIYSAPRDDIITIAGFINHEAVKEGRLEFVKHDRAIWDVEFLAIDELTRARVENQNIWLEILQENTLYGHKLKIKRTVVTLNPQATMYAGTFELDKALEDRFAFFLSVPEMQSIESEARTQMLDMSLGFHLKGRQSAESLESLKNTLDEIRERFDVLIKEERARAENFCRSYLDWLFTERQVGHLWAANDSEPLYISGRRQGFFLVGLLALTAAREILHEEAYEEAVERAAVDALKYILLGPSGRNQSSALWEFLNHGLIEMLPLLTLKDGLEGTMALWKILNTKEKIETIIKDPEAFASFDTLWVEKSIGDLSKVLNDDKASAITIFASLGENGISNFIKALNLADQKLKARQLVGWLLEDWIEFGALSNASAPIISDRVDLGKVVSSMAKAVQNGKFSPKQ